jgi:cell wall-associated NlpC family hydrolase
VAIVPGIDESTQLEGQSTIVADQPTDTGALPDALDYQPPDYLQPQFTPQPASSSAPGAPGLSNVDFSGSASAMRDKLVSAGMRYIGQPYSWGNLDCSGLVQRAYAAIGVHLPRISYQQANYGQRSKIGDLAVGDLVAWDEGPRNPGADHIAIYIGGGRILEAAHTGTDVRVRKLGKNEGAWGVHISLPGE